MCHTGLLTACEQDQDGTSGPSWLFIYYQDGTEVPSWSCLQAVSQPVWHIPLPCVQWRTPDDGQRNCPKHVEFHSKNKFEKLVHLVGFIIKKFITMHGHMNIKNIELCLHGAQRINWQEPSLLMYHIWYSLQLLGYTNLVLRTILLMCGILLQQTWRIYHGKIPHVANAPISLYFCNKIAWWWFWWTETWNTLTFRHRSFSMQDSRFATLQRTLFMYLINKYISLSDICLTVHHWYK